MDVVGHQAIRMDRALVLPAEMAEKREVREVVGIAPKAGVTVVAALNDMQCNTGQDQSRVPRHTGRTSEARRG
jgi:hypothetical protein